MELAGSTIDQSGKRKNKIRVFKENLLIFLQEKKIIPPREDQLDKELRQARDEWQKARKYFNCVTDPDLIDYAIYLIEAAEAKYSFLLKQKKLKSSKKHQI